MLYFQHGIRCWTYALGAVFYQDLIMINTNFSSRSLIYKVLDLIVAGFAVIVAARLFFTAVYNVTQWDSYELTDYLINYQGGYVRRGLLGELIFQISRTASSDPRIAIFSISLIAFISTVVIFIIQFKRQHLCFWILPLNICLGGAVLLRKDFLCILSVIAVLAIFRNLRSGVARNILLLLILVVGVNLHECVFFIIVPFVTMLTWYECNDVRTKVPRLMWILVPYISFILVSIFKGDANTAGIIHNSWQIAAMGNTPASTIASLAWDPVDTILFHIRETYLTPSYGVYGIIAKPIVWLISLVLIPNILFLKQDFSQSSSLSKKHAFIKVLIFQFFSLLPMLLFLSCDTSRIMFYWTSSAIAIFLFIPTGCLNSIFPQWFGNICEKAAKIVYNAKARVISIVFFPIICISPYFTSLDKAFERSFIGSYLSLYDNALKLIEALSRVME